MPDKLTDKERCLIFIPNNANYIEILGHKIDGFESFEAFCEHLKKYAELEETVNRLQEKNSNLTSDLTSLQKDFSSLKAENERLKDALIKSGELCDSAKGIIATQNGKIECLKEDVAQKIRRAKAEAYKECVEKVKEELGEWVGADKCIPYFRVKKVADSILKEFVGED